MLTFASSRSRFIGAAFSAIVLALFVGCGGQGTERTGGDDIPDLEAGTSSGGGGSGAEGGAGGVASGLVPWCDAYKVINCVCQQCHQDPVLNGAAMPLMTYEDTQARYPTASSSTLVWQKMQSAVKTGLMPDTTNPAVVPAVKPLTAEQKETLLDWLAQGAHDEGGRSCPNSCDWSN